MPMTTYEQRMEQYMASSHEFRHRVSFDEFLKMPDVTPQNDPVDNSDNEKDNPLFVAFVACLFVGYIALVAWGLAWMVSRVF